MVRIYMIYTK